MSRSWYQSALLLTEVGRSRKYWHKSFYFRWLRHFWFDARLTNKCPTQYTVLPVLTVLLRIRNGRVQKLFFSPHDRTEGHDVLYSWPTW